MIILRISGEYLVRISKNCSSNVTVRLKTPKLGAQSKFIWFLELYNSESANPRKVIFLHVKTPLRIILEKTKFSISKQFINR